MSLIQWRQQYTSCTDFISRYTLYSVTSLFSIILFFIHSFCSDIHFKLSRRAYKCRENNVPDICILSRLYGGDRVLPFYKPTYCYIHIQCGRQSNTQEKNKRNPDHKYRDESFHATRAGQTYSLGCAAQRRKPYFQSTLVLPTFKHMASRATVISKADASPSGIPRYPQPQLHLQLHCHKHLPKEAVLAFLCTIC